MAERGEQPLLDAALAYADAYHNPHPIGTVDEAEIGLIRAAITYTTENLLAIERDRDTPD